jgi:hypothetical protein
MLRAIIPLAVVGLLLACGSSLLAPPTPSSAPTTRPTVTTTLTPIPAPTRRPTETRPPLPSLTATTETFPATPRTRDEFERMVKAGVIDCRGMDNDDSSPLSTFLGEAYGAGIIPRGQLTLGGGIPSEEHPAECIYLITFDKHGKVYLVYEDEHIGYFVKIPIVGNPLVDGENS